MYRGSVWFLVGACLIVGTGCGDSSSRKPDKGTAQLMPGMKPTAGISTPVRMPPVKQANEVQLADNTLVVGILVGDKARAYTIPALSPMDRHVVNDLIGDVPISVTYCDINKCLRVFTNETRGKTLELIQMGRFTDGLQLRFEGVMYSQATGKNPEGKVSELPLKKLEVEPIPWKQWREKHPTTEVYTGPDEVPTGPPDKKS